MIGPKVDRPTAADERRAYAIASERDEHRCQKCHRGPAQRDHRKNRSQGGRTVASNLLLLCPTCHLWKTDHPVEAVQQGWAVPGWADPAEWPTRRYFRTEWGTYQAGWARLTDDGRVIRISDSEARRRMEGGES